MCQYERLTLYGHGEWDASIFGKFCVAQMPAVDDASLLLCSLIHCGCAKWTTDSAVFGNLTGFARLLLCSALFWSATQPRPDLTVLNQWTELWRQTWSHRSYLWSNCGNKSCPAALESKYYGGHLTACEHSTKWRGFFTSCTWQCSPVQVDRYLACLLLID
jgi:hypothetical protein